MKIRSSKDIFVNEKSIVDFVDSESDQHQFEKDG